MCIRDSFSSAGPIAVTRLEREKEMGIKSSESMEAEHPIVKTVNGKKTLYVSPGHLIKIKNVKEEDAEYLKNCLLYTSPSPRDSFRSRMPSSA